MIRALRLVMLLALFGGLLPAAALAAANPYAAIDHHALEAPPRAEESRAALACYLVEPAKNNKEKATGSLKTGEKYEFRIETVDFHADISNVA